MENNKVSGKNMPEKKFSAGGISATVWNNESTFDGKVTQYKTVTVDRKYKDKEGNWKTTSSMRVNDLPKLALVSQKAYEYLVFKIDGQEAPSVEEIVV